MKMYSLTVMNILYTNFAFHDCKNYSTTLLKFVFLT